MKTIYKYQFDTTDLVRLELPHGAKILHVDVQDGRPTMWAQVDTDAAIEQRVFYIFGTGHAIPDHPSLGIEFVATYMVMGGQLVFHMYEAK